MKSFVKVLIFALSMATMAPLSAQVSITSESTVKIDSTDHGLPVQKLEASTKFGRIRYDYKANGKDIFGIVVPKIVGDSITSMGGALVKMGDGNRNDQFVVDLWASHKWGKSRRFSSSLEMGRVFSPAARPWDFVLGRLSYGPITTEAGIVTSKPISEGISDKDAIYAWIAFHPKHAFVAVGKEIDRYWAFVGTKNLKRFGNLTFANYDIKTGNFWFRSQTGLGEINQKFFCQDLYVEATSYLVVPPFFYKHFSPLTTKGTYSIRLDGKRVGKTENYELMAGHIIGQNVLQVAIGLNSQHKDGDWKLAPSLEVFKNWDLKKFQASTELRYDLLYQAFSAYLIIKY